MKKLISIKLEKIIVSILLCLALGLSLFTNISYADDEEDDEEDYDYVEYNQAFFDYENWDGWHKQQADVLYTNMLSVQDISSYSDAYAIDYLVSSDFSGLSIDSIVTPALSDEEKTIIKELLLNSSGAEGVALSNASLSAEEVLPVVLGSVSYIRHRGDEAFQDMVAQGIFENSGYSDDIERYTYAVVKKICKVSESFKRWTYNISYEETGQHVTYAFNLHNSEDLSMFIILVFHPDIASALTYLPSYEVIQIDGNTSIKYKLNDIGSIAAITGIDSYYMQDGDTFYGCSAMYYILSNNCYVIKNNDPVLYGIYEGEFNAGFVTSSTIESDLCTYRNLTTFVVDTTFRTNNTGHEDFPLDVEHAPDDTNERPGLIIGSWSE